MELSKANKKLYNDFTTSLIEQIKEKVCSMPGKSVDVDIHCLYHITRLYIDDDSFPRVVLSDCDGEDQYFDILTPNDLLIIINML